MQVRSIKLFIPLAIAWGEFGETGKSAIFASLHQLNLKYDFCPERTEKELRQRDETSSTYSPGHHCGFERSGIAQTATETTTVPVDSQEPPALVNESGTVIEKMDGSETGAASADSDRADRLPIPFTDLSPEHWAFEAVMNLYY